MFALQYALAELLESWGVVSSVVMGRGIRELVAACLAGVVSLEDALKLAATRGMSKFRAAVSAAGLTGASMNMVLMSTGAKAADTLDAAFWLGQAGGAVQAAVAMGSTTFVEVGPGASLLGQLQAAVADVPDTLLVAAMDAFSGDPIEARAIEHRRPHQGRAVPGARRHPAQRQLRATPSPHFTLQEGPHHGRALPRRITTAVNKGHGCAHPIWHSA